MRKGADVTWSQQQRLDVSWESDGSRFNYKTLRARCLLMLY